MKRVAIALLSIVLLFAGVVFVIAGTEIADTPTCRDVNSGIAEPTAENECYDGSTTRRAVQVALCIGAGILAALAVIPGFAYAAREIWLRVFLGLTGAAILLGLLYALAGRVG